MWQGGVWRFRFGGEMEFDFAEGELRDRVFDAGGESAISVGGGREETLHEEREKKAGENERNGFKPDAVFKFDEVYYEEDDECESERVDGAAGKSEEEGANNEERDEEEVFGVKDSFRGFGF